MLQGGASRTGEDIFSPSKQACTKMEVESRLKLEHHQIAEASNSIRLSGGAVAQTEARLPPH